MNITRVILLIFILFIASSQASANEDAEVLESYAEKLDDVGKYEDAGRLYDKIALHYENESDWENASGYYLLAAENFKNVEMYKTVGASYINAGNCYYTIHDCDNASKYYLLGAESYKKSDPGYDDEWIEKKNNQCKEGVLMRGLAMFGILFGMIKFASKAAFGLGFANVGRREILAVADFYFLIAFLMSFFISMMRETLYEFINILFSFGMAFGVFQFILAFLLLTLGFYTLKKWKEKKNVSKKTFLLMILPCPVSLVTIFMTCAFFIITGMEAIKVGILVGGIFSLSIIGITMLIQRSKLDKTPSNLGAVMIFFGMLYLLSIIFIPAYLAVYDMNIVVEGFSGKNMMSGYLLAAFLIFIGFIYGQIINKRMT
ncbi:MAG: DUF2162 family putative transporter [Methanosarcinales archaeon]|nr:DUF2162 family putative transporter [Methanosarcinales archaeon]